MVLTKDLPSSVKRTGAQSMQLHIASTSYLSTLEDLAERGIHKEDWLLFSLDLNPIETVWNWMKGYVQ
jgi:hypothetical protein